MASNSVKASDGLYADQVLVTWKGDGYTHSYYTFYIYRWKDGESPKLFTTVKSKIDGQFWDTSAGTGDYYNYQVKQPDSFGNLGDRGTDRGWAVHTKGSAGNDKLLGSNSSEALNGFAGNDKLYGLLGNDKLNGGLGQDQFWGGKGSDTFIFTSVKDSPVGQSRDTIWDFKASEGDLIDLSAIDANTKIAGNQAFKFIGAKNFSKVAGELQVIAGGFAGDVNGDGKADFKIRTVNATLSKYDFIL